MELDLKINSIPLTLGQKLPREALDNADQKRTGLLRRLFSNDADRTVYTMEDCEFEGLDEDLRIYPCTHRYLNRDRQWHTKVTFFLKNDRLERLLFQVIEGQTAAMNFLERFETAANKFGEPSHRDRFKSRWQTTGARIETCLHPDRINADITIETIG